MADDKKSVVVKLTDIPLLSEGKVFKLVNSKSIKNGSNKWGSWFLWIVDVKDFPVYEGKGNNQKKIDNYNGEALLFARDDGNKKLEEIAAGKKDVEVKITRQIKENGNRIVAYYEYEKISDGVTDTQTLTPSEIKLISDAENLIKTNYNLSEDDLVKASKDPEYGGQITEERARQLYKYLKK